MDHTNGTSPEGAGVGVSRSCNESQERRFEYETHRALASCKKALVASAPDCVCVREPLSSGKETLDVEVGVAAEHAKTRVRIKPNTIL
jgi:hypothetical protein